MGPPAPSTVLGALVGCIAALAAAAVAALAVGGGDAHGGSAAAGATAEPGVANGEHGSFSALDLDGDGRVSLAEAAGHGDIVVRFDRADRDKDGRLTRTEFERLAKLPPPKPARKKPASRSP